MALATLSIDLVAQLANLQTGLDKATRLAEKQAADIEARYQRMARGVQTAFNVIASAVAVGQIAAFIDAQNNAILAIKDLSEASGSAVGKISGLDDVARRTGTSLDSVSGILLKFNKALGEAGNNKDLAGLFKALGLDVERLKALDPAEALQETAVALSQFADDGNKARLVQELFGKSVKEAAPFLNDLAEAGRLNGTVTAEQAESVDRLNKSVALLQSNLQDLARSILSAVVPALNQACARWEALGNTFGSVPAGLQALFFEDRITDAGAGVKQYTAELAKLKTLRDNLQASNDPFKGLSLERFDERIEKVQKLIQYYREIFSATAPDLGQSDPRELARRGRNVKPSLSLPELPPAPTGRAAPGAGRRSIDVPLDAGTIDAIRSLEQTDTARVQRLTEQLGALFELQRETRGNPAVAQAIAKTQEELAKLDPAARAAAAQMDAVNRALSETPAAKMAEATELAELLRIELEKTTDPERIKRLNQALQGVAETLGAMPTIAEPVKPKLEEISDIAKDMGLSFQSAFEDAVVGGKKLSDVLKGLAQDVLRIFLRKTVTEPLGNSLGNLFNGFDLGSLFGFSGASGAPPTKLARGMSYVPYDNFPALLHRGERVMTAAENQRGGGGIAINIINNGAPAEVSSSNARNTPNGMVVDLVLAAVARNVRQGGEVSRALSDTYGLGRGGSLPRRS
ncbi:MAG: hypothetical protein RLZZ524_789 [Pseudomonadota bacterium]